MSAINSISSRVNSDSQGSSQINGLMNQIDSILGSRGPSYADASAGKQGSEVPDVSRLARQELGGIGRQVDTTA